MKKKLLYTLYLFIVSIPSVCLAEGALPYGSGWYNEAQLTAAYQDNVNRGYKQSESLSDVTSAITVGRGYLKKTGTSSQVSVSGYFTYTQHKDYKALDNLATALDFQFTHQPVAGFYNVWFETALQVTRFDYSDSDVREGYLLEFDASLSRRLTTQLTGRVGYHYADYAFPGKSSEAKKAGQAFDTRTNEIYMGIDFELKAGVYVYAEYGYLSGDITSSVPKITGWGNDYDAESIDWAFEFCRDGVCKPYWAYRANGDIQRGDVGLSFPLFDLNFDLSAQYHRAEADSGASYRDWSVQLGIVMNF